MTQEFMIPRKSRNFYGWIAFSGTLVEVFIFGAIFIYIYGIFLPIMCAEFGWSRAIVATGYSIGVLAMGLPAPLVGYFVDRFGARASMVLGNLLAALALAEMAFVQEVWHVYLFWGLAGLGAGIGGFLPCTVVANNWFVRKRSLVMGIYLAAGGLGGFIFPPMTTALIDSIGWRMTWLVEAGLVLVFATIIGSLIMVRNKPEDMGQMPDGISAEPLLATREMEYLQETEEKLRGWQIKQIMKQPAIWLIAAFAAATLFGMAMMTTHQVAFIQDLGYSPMAAAMTMSLLSALGIVGGIGFGVLALKFNVRYLISACFIIRLIALGILLTTSNLAFIYIYAVLFGFSQGALGPAMPTLIGAYYGREKYAMVLGMIYPILISIQAAAPAIAGVIHDVTSTYTPAFALAFSFSIVGLVCAFMAHQPKLLQPDGNQ